MSDTNYYSNIPALTMGSINRYVNEGLSPGSFVTAVLCNDLFNAVGTADEENLVVLPEIVRYVYNELPSSAWGNLNKMNAWMKKGGVNDLS